jgi:hypothetical protein
MVRRNVAGLPVDVLADAGVRRSYGVSGDSLNGVTEGHGVHARPLVSSKTTTSRQRMTRTARRPAARRLRVLAWTTITVTTLPVRGGAQGLPPPLSEFLQQTIALDRRDMGAVTGGQPVAKVLATSDEREIALFGIVRIGVPRSFYVRLAGAFPSSLRAPSRIALGLFSDPPAASDVAGLSLPREDAQGLAHCRAGSCKVKLSAQAIAHLRATVDFASPAADSVVTAYFRERVIEYITAYRARGDSALVVYDDQQSRSAAAQVFQAMLARSPYLVNYPKDRPANLSEVMFWSEDDLPGLKPTVTLTHEVVYAPPELPGTTIIASKLLYAAHFLDGAFDLTAVVDQTGDQAAGPGGIYLVLVRRLHFDDLPSGGPLNVRGRVIGELLKRTRALLRDTKARSERAYTGRLTTHAPSSPPP